MKITGKEKPFGVRLYIFNDKSWNYLFKKTVEIIIKKAPIIMYNKCFKVPSRENKTIYYVEQNLTISL